MTVGSSPKTVHTQTARTGYHGRNGHAAAILFQASISHESQLGLIT
jgi:hypothetical protein